MVYGAHDSWIFINATSPMDIKCWTPFLQNTSLYHSELNKSKSLARTFGVPLLPSNIYNHFVIYKYVHIYDWWWYDIWWPFSHLQHMIYGMQNFVSIRRVTLVTWWLATQLQCHKSKGIMLFICYNLEPASIYVSTNVALKAM